MGGKEIVVPELLQKKGRRGWWKPRNGYLWVGKIREIVESGAFKNNEAVLNDRPPFWDYLGPLTYDCFPRIPIPGLGAGYLSDMAPVINEPEKFSFKSIGRVGFFYNPVKGIVSVAFNQGPGVRVFYGSWQDRKGYFVKPYEFIFGALIALGETMDSGKEIFEEISRRGLVVIEERAELPPYDTHVKALALPEAQFQKFGLKPFVNQAENDCLYVLGGAEIRGYGFPSELMKPVINPVGLWTGTIRRVRVDQTYNYG